MMGGGFIQRYFLQFWLIIGFAVLLLPVVRNRSSAQFICSGVSAALASCACATLLSDDFFLLPHCFGIFATVGWYIVGKFGVADSRFAARKFITYHLLAVLLLCIALVLALRFDARVVLCSIALCVFSATYPFHGWIEHFFAHAPSCLVVGFLLFFRTVAWFFTLQLLSTAISIENYAFFRGIFLSFGFLGALFVPILFFSKRENRKFLGYAVCWQNGVLWLILPCCRICDYAMVFELAVIQGFLLASIFLGFVENQKRLKGDGIVCIKAMFAVKKSRACALCLALIFLGMLPLFGFAFMGVSRLYVASCSISCLLYFCFAYRAFVEGRVGL
jgi:hypothetical protein